jgi:uncharacterized protein (DUF1778 family)
MTQRRKLPMSEQPASGRTRHPRALKPAAKRARFAARLTDEQKELFARAAALRDQPVSQFVISSAQHAAEQAIREHEVMTLTARDSRAFMAGLLHPEPASPRLRAGAEHYKSIMGDG